MSTGGGNPLDLLTTVLTPAVLVSACGTLLIAETRLALRSVLTEMELAMRLGARRMNGEGK